MLNWISNNPDAAIAVLTIVGGWLGLSKKKADLGRLKDQALAALRGEVFALIDEHASIAQARVHLERAASALLNEIGVKRSKAVDAIVAPIIEQVLKEYSERLGPKLLQAKLDELVTRLSKLPGAFEVEESTIPKLEFPNIEIVPADQPFVPFPREGAVQPTDDKTVIVYGDDFTEDSARQRQQKAAEIVRAKIAENPPPEDK